MILTVPSVVPFCQVGVTLSRNWSAATSRTLFWPRLSSPTSGRPVLTVGRQHVSGNGNVYGVRGRGWRERRSDALGGNVAPVEKRRTAGVITRLEAAASIAMFCAHKTGQPRPCVPLVVR